MPAYPSTDPTRDPLWKYCVAACVPAISVFFLIPFELFYHQVAEWNFNHSMPLAFAAFGLVACLLLAGLTFLLLKWRRKLGIFISIILFCLGTFILLADGLAPLDVGELTGAESTGAETVSKTIAEALIFLVLVAATVFAFKHVVAIAAPFTGILLLITVAYLGFILAAERPHIGPAFAREKNPDIVGNVYHIVLDELQTDAALLYLAEDGKSDAFQGFTMFPNNMSSYLYTRASMPSYMTGSIHNKGSFRKWRTIFKEEGLLKDMYDKGYRITMHSPRPAWRNQFVAEFHSLQDTYEKETRVTAPLWSDFVGIWFARILPNFLTDEALPIGRRCGRSINGRVAPSEDDPEFAAVKGVTRTWFPTAVMQGIEPFSSVLMLKRLVKDEARRESNGEYVYAHAIIPHGPYVFRADGTFDLRMRRLRAYAYYCQIEFAFSLVEQFLAELKRLGRYGSSTIVIHSDTGHGHRAYVRRDGDLIIGSDPKRKQPKLVFLGNNLNWTKDQIVARTRAVLMVKPAGATGAMRHSDSLASLLDLRPTLTGLLKMPRPASALGVALFDEDPPADRESMFFLYNSRAEEPKEIMKIVVANQRDPKNSKLIVHGYRGKHPARGVDSNVVFVTETE